MSVLPRLQVITEESCKPLLPLPFKTQVYSGSQPRLQLVFKNNSREVSQRNHQKSKAPFPTASPPAAQGCSQQLNKQQLCLLQPRQWTGVRGCQRASEMSAGSCQHLSLQTLALYFLTFKHIPVPGKEEVGDVLYFLFIPHVKLWIHMSYRLNSVNLKLSGIFISVLSKG